MLVYFPCFVSVNSDGLSEKQIARGNFYLRPADRYRKRQQDLLDMDEDNGSEDSWTYCKDERDSQAAKNSTGNKKLRFLNMDPIPKPRYISQLIQNFPSPGSP